MRPGCGVGGQERGRRELHRLDSDDARRHPDRGLRGHGDAGTQGDHNNAKKETARKRKSPSRLRSDPLLLELFLPLYLTELEINFAVYRNKSRPTFRKRFVGNRTGSRSKR